MTGYILNYDWGESWQVFADDFEDRKEYWFKIMCRNIEYYREHTKDELEAITSCAVYRVNEDGREYVCLVSVGITAGYVLGWWEGERIEERYEKEEFL